MVLFRRLALVAVFASGLAQAQAQREPAVPRSPESTLQELQKLAWQRGPGEGAIGGKATIRIPEFQVFLDERNTRRFLELMGNPPRDGHYLIAPFNLSWFAVFSFDPVGYVKDDEKIDADALLASLKKGDGPGNEERKRLGMEPIFTDGWHVPPHYDAGTRRLEWGMRLRDQRGGVHVNYTSRLLGRSGVMSATLVSSPETLSADMQAFNGALAGFSFAAGEKYAEFKEGDRIAEYGLGALVLGGAAAAAAKAGWLKILGKYVWLILAGALAGGGALWRRLFGRKDGPPPSPGQQ